MVRCWSWVDSSTSTQLLRQRTPRSPLRRPTLRSPLAPIRQRLRPRSERNGSPISICGNATGIATSLALRSLFWTLMHSPPMARTRKTRKKKRRACGSIFDWLRWTRTARISRPRMSRRPTSTLSASAPHRPQWRARRKERTTGRGSLRLSSVRLRYAAFHPA